MAEAEESPAQRQARLRREKRNAKIQATGDDRLAKITQLSGRPAPAPEDPTSQSKTTNTAPAAMSASVEDPDEVDISEHHYVPTRRPENQLAELQQQQQQAQMNPFAMFGGGGGANAGGAEGQDPMMQIMQQMLSGGGMPDTGNPNDPNNPMNDLPPMLKAMMNGQRQTQQQGGAPTNSAYIWRIAHAVFAFSLALYIALTTTFNGSKLSRAQSVDDSQGPRLFYLFATAELVLQSSRYFLEQGQLMGKGWIATIANSGLVPEPWAGYIRVFGRYSVIWQTIVGDAVTIVFVLGALAWWRGMTIA